MPRGLVRRLLKIALGIAMALALAACGAVSTPTTNRYQQPPPGASAPAPDAVGQLQRDARAALDGAAPERAIDYLQRAIRIEPRNASSWQLLAEAWRQAGDGRRCVEMARRAASYGRGDAAFERDNRRLLDACQRD